MNLPRQYQPLEVEKKWQQYWKDEGIYHFTPTESFRVFSIDTPPPTVSGDLHLGHSYSYSQTDFMARFFRMSGNQVYYPMGWDDNGLPTERLVEKRLGIKPEAIGREKFIAAISQVSRELEEEYERIWRRLGLSVDWRYTYSTIGHRARRISQYSFVELCHKGLIYRASAPTIWCPTCGTAIAQAELNDLERESVFVTLPFQLDDGQVLPIATTRPELLPACVAVMVNPTDRHHSQLAGRTVETPLFEKEVPVIADHDVDVKKGTGVVMCCTFGDATDVEWWRRHGLPLVDILDRSGHLTQRAGPYAGMDVRNARRKIIGDLARRGLLLDEKHSVQSVRVHERCDTPIEYIQTSQWFIRLLDRKEEFLKAGESISWYPDYMRSRYESWVRNLGWDWCISRQRYYGVPIPVWYCADCGEIILPELSELPVDPLTQQPSSPCHCGSNKVVPETDVLDTWATSSLSPEIAGKWLEDQPFFGRVFPMALRPQSHDIIRTWTFYTIVKSLYHLGQIPWASIAVSGHGVAPEGGKVSKSRAGGAYGAMKMMDKYSADAVRYWAASTRLGRDSLISEDKIAMGKRLVTKLWNAARLTLTFLKGYKPPDAIRDLQPADRWLLSRLQGVVRKATEGFAAYDHVAAKDEVEAFFWNALTDNYLEMVKVRLYELDDGDSRKAAAKYTLHLVLLAIIKMFAPIMPYVTEEIYQLHFRETEGVPSIHLSKWPEAQPELMDSLAEVAGEALVGIATEVRRFKTNRQTPLNAPLKRLHISASDPQLLASLQASVLDIRSVTRAQAIEFAATPAPDAVEVPGVGGLRVAIEA